MNAFYLNFHYSIIAQICICFHTGRWIWCKTETGTCICFAWHLNVSMIRSWFTSNDFKIKIRHLRRSYVVWYEWAFFSEDMTIFPIILWRITKVQGNMSPVRGLHDLHIPSSWGLSGGTKEAAIEGVYPK